MPLSRLLALVAPPLCVCCGAPARVHDPLCGACRRDLRWLPPEQAAAAGVSVWAPVAYEGPARALVRALKFRGAVRLVDAVAAQMAANAPPGLLDGRSLVPVPIHPARRRRRGFNQAELLATALSKRSGLRVAACLERVSGGARASQVGMGREERLSALRDAVRVRRRAPVPPLPLLVDDVVTTGATLAACAGSLATAGACDVAAIVYARTTGR